MTRSPRCLGGYRGLPRLVEAHTYRPLWSDQVLREVERSFPLVGSAMSEEEARRRVEVMRARFRDAQVTDYESLIPSRTNGPKARPVLTAAVRGGAALIRHRQYQGLPV